MRGLYGAFQFLTILPLRTQPVPLGATAPWFPVVGALLGAGGGYLYLAAVNAFSKEVAALLVLAAWAIATGGLHEDALADVVDAFRSHRSPQRILAILKDSRIGAHGALALLLFTLLRWQSLVHLALPPVRTLASALAVSRASMIALAWIASPAGEGLGRQLASSLTTAGAVIAVSVGVAGAFLSGPVLGIWICSGSAAVLIFARRYFERRIGGVTGDCIGATGFVIESWILLLAAGQSSTQ